MAKNNTIPFVTPEGEEVIFSVLEQTTLGGINYLLVGEETEEDEMEVYILKEITSAEDEISYEMISDEEELMSVSDIFEELLEDVDIELED